MSLEDEQRKSARLLFSWQAELGKGTIFQKC